VEWKAVSARWADPALTQQAGRGPIISYCANFFASLKRRWQALRIPIAYRLAITFTLLIVVGMGVLSAVVLRYQTNLMHQQIDRFGGTIAEQFARSATEPLFTDDLFTLQVMTNNLMADEHILGAAVFNDAGAPLFETGAVPVAELAGALDASSSQIHTQIPVMGSDLTAFAAPISFKEVVGGHAVVTVSTASVQESFQQTISVLAAATAAMTLLGVAIAYWMSRRTAQPVNALVEATDRVAQGDYNLQLAPRRDEFGHLGAALQRMAGHLRERNQMAGILSRFVADDVAKTMLDDLDHVELGCKPVEASVLFVDIVGYTRLSESLGTEELVELLNEYFAYFTVCSRLFFGTVDKFIGDCAMIIFGAPKPDPDHRFNAIACAVVMTRLLKQLNQRRRAQGLREVEVRIGVNSGEMMAGIVGGAQRMEYTVLGDTVNVASRLGRLAEPGEVRVGGATVNHESLKDRVEFTALGETVLRGRTQPTRVYGIERVAPQHQLTMNTLIEDILEHQPPRDRVEGD